MEVAWLVGDPRSVAARILPSGSSVARQFHIGHKYIFAEHFSCCNNLGRDVDGWKMVKGTNRMGSLIGTTLLFKGKTLQYGTKKHI